MQTRNLATEIALFGGQTFQNTNLATEMQGFGGQTAPKYNLSTKMGCFGGQSVVAAWKLHPFRKINSKKPHRSP